MREIKFRMWNIPTKIMLQMVDLEKCTQIITSEDGLFLPLNDEKVIIMQYTGLKDKNGVEIYEGDIVNLGSLPNDEEDGTEDRAQVLFSDGRFWCTHYGFPVKSWACNENCYIDVIGNIHENPELLKG